MPTHTYEFQVWIEVEADTQEEASAEANRIRNAIVAELETRMDWSATTGDLEHVGVDGEGDEPACPRTNLSPAEWAALAADAKPSHPDDWGSERQIAAENKFWDAMTEHGYCLDEFETMKASTEEMLDIAMKRIANQDKQGAFQYEVR